MNTKTIQERFEAAKKEIRKNGVKVRVNIYECCRGCVTNEKLGIKTNDDPIIWHYGGQDHAFSFASDGLPYYRSYLYGSGRKWYRNAEEFICNPLFNHNSLSAEQRDMVVAAFENNGLVVVWGDNNEERDYKCIEIDIDATIERDNAAQAAASINNPEMAMC